MVVPKRFGRKVVYDRADLDAYIQLKGSADGKKPCNSSSSSSLSRPRLLLAALREGARRARYAANMLKLKTVENIDRNPDVRDVTNPSSGVSPKVFLAPEQSVILVACCSSDDEHASRRWHGSRTWHATTPCR